jgi:hypothetical protein
MASTVCRQALWFSLLFVLTTLLHADTKPASQWAVTRKSTPAEQRENHYRKSTWWSFHVDFHDNAAAHAAFEPVTNDLTWLKCCRRPRIAAPNGPRVKSLLKTFISFTAISKHA